MTTRLPALLACAVFLVAGCSTQPASHMHEGSGAATASAPVLFDNLGGYHRAITTRSPQAQAYFDQELRLVYGFNHYEAQAAFREALENGWSLFGLAQSLRAQGKSADAAAVDERFRRAWARADVTLTASRF
jgi:hypothetical protein